MKPMLIIPIGQMSDADIKLLNENGICTVTAADPSAIKFVDPIPCITSRTEMENAAIRLSRFLISEATNNYSIDRGQVVQKYVEFLVQGTPLDRNGTLAEREKKYFDNAKQEELLRLAREEAKEERRAAKEAAKKAEKK